MMKFAFMSRRPLSLLRVVALAVSLLAPVVAVAAEEKVMLNFANADIEATIRAIGLISNRNFVIDPRVKGTINIVSSRPVTKSDVYPILLASLRLQGFTAVEAPGVTKILPEADAKLHGAPITRKVKAGGDSIVTQVYPMQYESAVQMVPILRPLITPNNLIAAYPSSNTLVITDYADNIARLNKIIASIDQPQDNLLLTIPLKNGSAVDMAQLIGKLMPDVTAVMNGPMPGQVAMPINDGARKTVVLPDLRTNSIIVKAGSNAQMEQVKRLVEELDVPLQGAGNIRVIYLKNAEAARLVQTLRGVLTGAGGDSGSSSTSGSSSSPMAGNAGGNTMGGSASSGPSATFGSSAAGTGVSLSAAGAIIQADSATNSLIINAPEPVYNNVRAIVEKLDVRRAQVYVETMIAEVNANVEGEFGIQWLLGGEGSGLSGFATSALSGGTNNIVTVATSVAGLANGSSTDAAGLKGLGNGFNIGLLNGSVSGQNGQRVANLGFLASAIARNGNGNVLSTPNILTLDNEQASILVGENVPFVTGTQASTGSNPNPFTTVERKDVGITLKIKPQVSEGGAITLSVYQEVSSVDRTTASGIITKKRSIESKVLVDDGQIIVLGGLMQDEVTGGTSEVPLLGRIPIIGNLFRYDNRSHRKTNLMVFLRPTVLRDGPAANALSSDRYELLRRAQAATGAEATLLLPAVPVVTLPPAPKVQTPPPAQPAAPAAPAPATDAPASKP